MKRFPFLVILLFTTVFAHTADHIVINSGHTKPVNALMGDAKNNLLFTGDENGTVKIWDTAKNHLIKNLQISHLPIRYIAVNPVSSDIAVLVTDNLNTFKLSVWNWKKGVKKFTHRLSELPLSLTYSPKGTFIVYSKPDWNSLTFLDAEKGYRKQFLTGDTGIVSAVYVSASEKTLLLYTPSGTIQYWDLKTGNQKIAPIRTKGNLTSILFAPNGAKMTGFYNNEIYLIDLVSGTILDTAEKKGIVGAAEDFLTGNTAFLSKSGGKNFFDTYSIQGSTLIHTGTMKLSIEADKTGLVYSNNSVFFTSGEGVLYRSRVSSKTTTLFAKNIYGTILDLGLTNGRMLISSGKGFTLVHSGLLSSNTDSSLFTVTDYPVRENVPVGIVASPDNNFYYYRKDTSPGFLKQFSTNGFERTITEDFQSGINSISFAAGDFLSLEKNGRCTMIDQNTGETKFSYTSYGIQSISLIHSGNIIAGRNQTGLIKSPLLNINTATEEVVPVRDSNILTFKVDYDPVTRILYSLGFEKKDSDLKTVLKAHRGKSLEITETLLTYPGEDSKASVIVDKNRSRVFTTLGFGGIHMLSWNGFTSLESSDHIPRKLFLHNNILASLNSDATISLWDTSSGKLLMDFYIIKDGGWAAVGENGKVFASPSAKKYILNVQY